MNRIAVSFATLFGVGSIPKFPGTAASLLTLPLAGALAAISDFWTYVAVSAAVTLVSIPICGRSAQALGEEDPSCVVLDEVAGMLIAAMPLTVIHKLSSNPYSSLAAAFVLFRIFDIWKPGIIGRAQDLKGGWGIVLDDVLAGILAAAVLSIGSGILPAPTP